MLCTCHSPAQSPCPGTIFVVAPVPQPKPPEPPRYRGARMLSCCSSSSGFTGDHRVFYQEDRDLAQREATSEDAAACTSLGISPRGRVCQDAAAGQAADRGGVTHCPGMGPPSSPRVTEHNPSQPRQGCFPTG